MAAAAILKIQVNDLKSVAIAHIYTIFGSETEIPLNFKMADVRHYENT